MSHSDFIDILSLQDSEITPLNIRHSIKRAFRIGIFEDIKIKCLDETCFEIMIEVKERPIVKKIKFHGNQSFSDSELSSQILLKQRHRFDEYKLSKSVANIKNFLFTKGYINANVEVKAHLVNPNEMTVNFYIQEGIPQFIKDVIVNDPLGIIDEKIPFEKGSILDLTLLEEIEAKINTFLKNRDVIGDTLRFTIDNNTLFVDLANAFYLKISFDGSVAFGKDILVNELPFFQNITVFEDAIYEAKERLRQLYIKNGYIDVEIVPVVFKEDDNQSINLTFYIFEGQQYFLSSIVFSGNTLPYEKLLAYLDIKEGKFYDKFYVEQTTEILKDFYSSLGYLNAVVSLQQDISTTGAAVKLYYLIKEGEKFNIKSIEIEGNYALGSEKIIEEIPLKSNNPHNDFDINISRRKIIELYEQMGYASVAVKVDVHFDGNSSKIKFIITEGRQSFFGKTLLSGNVGVNSEVITRQLYDKEGKPFNIPTILHERQRLYKLGLFDDIKYSIISDDSVNTKDVLYTFTEGKYGAVEFILGYGEYERQRAAVELSYRNLGGMNRFGSLRTEVSSIEKRLIITFLEPWLMDAKTSLKSSLLAEHKKERSIDRKDIRYKIDRTTANLGIDRVISDAIKWEFFYDVSIVNTYEIKPDIILSKEDTGTLLISGLRSSLIYDKRDNVFEPKSGFLTGISLKYASNYLLSETDFYKLSMYFNNYQSLTNRFIIALSVKFGIAKGLGKTQELPIVERFFLGGRSSVRGFVQDELGPKGALTNTPTGGNAFTAVSSELRANVYKGFGLVTFVDGGNVWNNTKQMDTTALRYSTGVGLRYNTPVGPFRLDYGWKIRPLKNETKGELHFTLGHTF